MAIDILDILMSNLEDNGIIKGWTEFMQKEKTQIDTRKDDAEQQSCHNC